MKATKANLVLKNGSIYTLDANQTWAQAIAIAGLAACKADHGAFEQLSVDIEAEHQGAVMVGHLAEVHLGRLGGGDAFHDFHGSGRREVEGLGAGREQGD